MVVQIDELRTSYFSRQRHINSKISRHRTFRVLLYIKNNEEKGWVEIGTLSGRYRDDK